MTAYICTYSFLLFYTPFLVYTKSKITECNFNLILNIYFLFVSFNFCAQQNLGLWGNEFKEKGLISLVTMAEIFLSLR